MVQSSSISITPSKHADRHQTTGEDPLTSPVRVEPHHATHETGGADEIASVLHTRTYALSADIIDDNATERSNNSVGMAKLKETLLGGTVPDTLTIYYQGKHGNSSSFGGIRVYRNGAAVGTLHDPVSTSWTGWSQDIAGWSTGDLLQIYGLSEHTSYTIHTKDLQVRGLYGAPVVSIGSNNEMTFTHQDP